MKRLANIEWKTRKRAGKLKDTDSKGSTRKNGQEKSKK
jgi:hypothetical protein